MSRDAQLDRRLARLLSTLDAAPGFETRLAARLERERAAGGDLAARAQARERACAARRVAEAALRKSLRRNVWLVAGTALAAAGPALVWTGQLMRLLERVPGGGLWLGGLSCALLAGWAWTVSTGGGRGAAASALYA